MSQSKGKIFLFNVIGIILGIVGGLLAYNIIAFVFAILAKIPIIPQLMSWPVDFEWYCLTGILCADIFAGISICKYFCDKADAKLNYGIIVLTIINVIRYINGLIQNIDTFGFSFSIIFVYIFAFGSIFVAFVSSVSNNE